MASTKSNKAFQLVQFMIFIFTFLMTIVSIGIHGLTTISLIPITSLSPKNLTLLEKHHKMVEYSRARIFHLQKYHFNAQPNTITLEPSILRYGPTAFYITQLSIGSKPYSPYMAIDTGSSFSWVQCEGCLNCFPVNDTGNFKYKESQSYRNLPCTHPLCVPKMCTHNGVCAYKIDYINATSSGVVSTETFTFPTNSNQTTVKYSSLVFGCGVNNTNINFGNLPYNIINWDFWFGP